MSDVFQIHKILKLKTSSKSKFLDFSTNDFLTYVLIHILPPETSTVCIQISCVGVLNVLMHVRILNLAQIWKFMKICNFLDFFAKTWKYSKTSILSAFFFWRTCDHIYDKTRIQASTVDTYEVTNIQHLNSIIPVHPMFAQIDSKKFFKFWQETLFYNFWLFWAFVSELSTKHHLGNKAHTFRNNSRLKFYY